ncbi:MAG: 50S ribosomal protein L29 [Candidatus Bathyarchaeota archaeon]|jgi:large subunit ribosomal protein L29|nr:50S ribosomal protein L29 [Candidatus Bathyarchaeota archaeon]
MPILRVNEVREMDPDERETKIRELQIELAKLRALIRAGGALENPARVKAIRRAIAQIKTIQNEAQNEGG